MRNLNKKALSDVISTILIILLSIALIGVFWNLILGLIDNPSLSPETSCPIILSKNPISIQKACYNSNQIELTLSRNLNNIKINSFGFIIDEEKAFSCGNQCGECYILDEGSSKTYYIPSEETPNTISLQLNGCLIKEKEIESC